MLKGIAIAVLSASVWVCDGVRQTPRSAGWVRDGVRYAPASVTALPHYEIPSVPGMVLWLDADDASTMTLGAGGGVAVWNNKGDVSASDYLVPAYPADAATFPVAAPGDGRGWVRWTDASKPLVQGGLDPWGGTVSYLFVVFEPIATVNSVYASMMVAVDASTDYSFRLIGFTDGPPASFSVAVNQGDFGYSGYGGFLHCNGVTLSDQSVVQVTGPLIMSINLGSGPLSSYQLSSELYDRYFCGLIGEVVGFSGLPSEESANAVLSYLGLKWGVSVTAMEFPEPPPAGQVTVCFDGCGGFVPEGEESMAVTVGGIYGTLPGPAYDGHTFVGWYSYDLGGYVDSETVVTIGYDHTLYAVWN